MSDIAQDIRDLRETTKLSQRDFAAIFGIPKATLQDWEQGRRTPPCYIVYMMQRILALENKVRKGECTDDVRNSEQT